MLAWVVIHRRHRRLARTAPHAHLFRSPRPLLRCAFCIPDGFAGRSDVQTLRRSGGSSHVFACPPIAYRRSVTLLESTLEKVPHKPGLTTFRINTCKSVSKQRTLTIFRMNTYEKQGEGVSVIVNQQSEKDSCPERPSGVKDLSSFPKRIPVLRERSGMGRGRPLPEFFVGSFFG